jgi:hypothetical protein
MRFHITHVTLEIHWVCLKWFPSLWYVHPNWCTYLAPRLRLSPKKPKQASIWPTSPRSSVRSAQKDFRAYCTYDTNGALILCADQHYLQTEQNELTFDPCHRGGPSGATKKISMPMVHLAQTVLLSWPNVNTSPSRPKQTSTWPTSPRSSIRCTQNDFWAYCTFGTNGALILHWD